MEAAEQLGIRIPRLCYHPDLSLAGSCRVCIVDVKGMGYYLAACSSQVWEGMEVQTNSPEIRQARRDIVELLLDNHNMDCQTCERDGHCELQNLAYSMGVRARHFEGRRKRFPIEMSSHSVVRDSEKCVLCGRCVRVCAEIQGVYNLSQHGRGFDTVVAPGPRGQHGRLGLHPVRAVHQRLPHGRLPGKAQRRRRSGTPWPIPRCTSWCRPPRRSARPSAKGFGLPPGTPATGQMVTALRRLGFDRGVRHRLRRRPDDHRGSPRVPHAAEGRPAADDHLLLAGLDQFPGEVLSRADPARLDLPLADEHALGAGQDLLCREGGHRPEEDFHGGGDALRGEEVRGPAARAFHRPTACPIPTPC